MNTDVRFTVTEIQRFCMHDGPGVRTTVFFKGCPLRCQWCHNPETQKAAPELLYYPTKCIGCRLCESVCPKGVHAFEGEHTLKREKCVACGACVKVCPSRALELCGRETSIEELLTALLKDRAFYGEAGGVTLSGGEPLMQGEKLVDLLAACKEKGLSTAIETCGYGELSLIEKVIPYTDLFLWDVKDTDALRHRQYTGVSNEKILENLRAADALGAKTRLRCILVNGVNTDETHYRKVSELALSLKHCEGVEWLPYHAYGGTKSVFIGEPDNGNKLWIPTKEQLAKANEKRGGSV